jgi:hypothetical protein
MKETKLSFAEQKRETLDKDGRIDACTSDITAPASADLGSDHLI